MAQRTLNTPRETTHQRIADALEDIVDKMVDTSSASNVNYDNAQSGLSANKVQGAVDELASEKADKSTTLAGYGITDAYTKAEVYTQSEVNNIVSTLETNIDWKEAVNTYADIATTYPNPQDGWTVNVKDTDYTYRYNGSEWVAISANAIPEATTSVKGLMTPTQVSKLNGIEAGAQVNTVTSVAGKTGAVTLTKSDVGLGNVDNTSDLDKPISTAAQTALNDKVDKVQGKGLSTNDYTNEEKQKNADNASAISDIQEDISQSLTATGNPITIESSESNLVECVAEVEAVQEGSGDPSPDNIRPITGQTEVVIEDVGKNLFDEQTYPFTNGKYIYGATGGDDNSGVLKATLDYIPCDKYAGETVTLNARPQGETPGIAFYDSNKTFVSGIKNNNNTSSSWTFTIPSDAKYMRFCVTSSATNVQIEQGTTATTYEPYKGKTYTIQLGDTIYGGELDVLTGELRVTHGEVDLGDLNWMYTPGYGGMFYAHVSGAKFSGGQSLIGYDCYCSQYASKGNIPWTKLVNGEINVGSDTAGNGRPYVNIKDNRYTDTTAFTTAVTGQTLVYELAEPYTIQLTPQQIRLLKGTNNISCNTGDLSIKYYPDNVLGQLKGDIEDEIDAVVNRIKGVKTMQISGAAVSTDGSIMFTNLIGSIIVGTSISNDANGNKCVGIPYSMGIVPALKIMNESTMAVLPNITISGILYYIEL